MLLEAKNLKKIYKLGETDVKAVDNISICFKEETFYTIIGKSGSGKSTLLHMLSGMVKPTTGKVNFLNQDISSFNDKQISELKRNKFGFVFQSYNLLPELCVVENILMPRYLDNKTVDEKFLNQLIEGLDIKKIKNKFPVQLSGGEQQRVAIARALINRPKIIFADEPTGNLDRDNSREVMNLLTGRMRELKQTIILVTHDTDIAKQADVVIELQDGKIKRQMVRRDVCVE